MAMGVDESWQSDQAPDIDHPVEGASRRLGRRSHIGEVSAIDDEGAIVKDLISIVQSDEESVSNAEPHGSLPGPIRNPSSGPRFRGSAGSPKSARSPYR